MTEMYKSALQALNTAQRQAVQTIDGPVLVIAGPGTGKTQLLSTRVAYILASTDTTPDNILCLTFTENAAQEMRERLVSIIGDAAHKVHISTYHSFGSELLRGYPEYVERISREYGVDGHLERPIDDITRYEIVHQLLQSREHNDSLSSAIHYVRDVIATISECKRSLIGPDELRDIARENAQTIASVSEKINQAWCDVGQVPRTLTGAEPLYMNVAEILGSESTSLAEKAYQELELAFEKARATNRSTPLTEWKNDWLLRTSSGWRFTDEYLCQRMLSLADVFVAYNQTLASRGLYDFDDMIIKAIETLQHSEELRLTLQERYLYILLDEFQDTNAAQFELVQLLSDSPIHEGRPNIMAVGDDDQAIYAFQGAEIGNMAAFLRTFRDVTVINLNENYRSHPSVLELAEGISSQITTRLHHNVSGFNKTLRAAAINKQASTFLQRYIATTKASEYTWVAHQIQQLSTDGEKLSEIAVLAPKHKYLEELVPYLNNLDLPVSYEKRENILQTPIIQSLRMISQLIIAVHDNDIRLSEHLFPIVLSLPFWGIDPQNIWSVNWQRSRQKEERLWHEIALDSEVLRDSVTFLLALSSRAKHEPLEKMLDYMCGTQSLDNYVISPLSEYYFSDRQSEQAYFETITHLSVIREKVRGMQFGSETLLTLSDFLKLFELYELADQPLLNTHPVKQADDAVQFMTVYKAKGLEFNHVFLLSVQDAVWGPTSHNNSNKLSLPRNLTHIRYRGGGDDELLRILFVAVTRARFGLHLSSHLNSDDGKKQIPLRYLQGNQIETLTNLTDETAASSVSSKDLSSLIHLWQPQHTTLTAPLKQLLKDRLTNYRLSPTHMNTYIDMEWGGPQAFLLTTLLQFPQAPSLSGEYGNAIHDTLEWYQLQLKHKRPSIDQTVSYFTSRVRTYYIPPEQVERIISRGADMLSRYLHARSNSFHTDDLAEYDFRTENVYCEGVPLTGKIDRIIVDKTNKHITVVDYKTGQQFSSWRPNHLKLLKYRQQLYMYKLLIEGSRQFQGYSVQKGRLEFVEPDQRSGEVAVLELDFDDQELDQVRQLLGAIYKQIMSLDFPDTSTYSKDLQGTTRFIDDLLSLT